MKTKLTYNSYTNWRKTSLLWAEMNELQKDENRAKRNRYIRLKDGRSYPAINNFWYFIGREFNEKFGGEFALREHFSLLTGEQLTGDNIHLNIPSIYIHTSVCSCLDIEIQFTVNGFYTDSGKNWFSVVPPKNMEYTKENIVKFVFSYVNNNLFYAPGLFKNIQLDYCCDKDTAKRIYKEYLESKKMHSEYLDKDTVLQWVKRKFNIDGSHVELDKLINYVNKSGKSKKLIVLAEFDWGYVYSCCNEIDGDCNELESMFYQSVDEVLQPEYVYV